jgi:hypothetical protein
MIVDKDFMAALKREAKSLCGGSRHKLEVQTWSGKIDIDGLDLDDCDDIDHINLECGSVLPDDAGEIDIAVWGYSPEYGDVDRLGNMQIKLQGGKLVEAWT